MPEIVANCPRCGAKKHTFIAKTFLPIHRNYGWQNVLESYCICKNCLRGTVFRLNQKDSNTSRFFDDVEKLHEFNGSLNQIVKIDGYVSLRSMAARPAPEHIPKDIEKIFKEGSESLTGNCPNAAGAMFRLCIDLTTKDLLPKDDEDKNTKESNQNGPNQKVKKYLNDRLKWLFKNRFISEDLEDLADNIRLDGNDGAHDGTLTSNDAEDLFEFTHLLLERVYTVPEKASLAKKRRDERREKAKDAA